jgi:hypothetical protein
VSTLVPLYVDGETALKALAAILKANGFALRCDLESRLVAEPIAPGLFNLVRRDDLPHVKGAPSAA